MRHKLIRYGDDRVLILTKGTLNRLGLTDAVEVTVERNRIVLTRPDPPHREPEIDIEVEMEEMEKRLVDPNWEIQTA